LLKEGAKRSAPVLVLLPVRERGLQRALAATCSAQTTGVLVLVLLLWLCWQRCLMLRRCFLLAPSCNVDPKRPGIVAVEVAVASGIRRVMASACWA
jgi:hypothetical protein